MLSTHPHNIYLEILVETIGWLALFIIFMFLFESLNFSSKSIIYKGLIMSNLMLFFPFVTTGTFLLVILYVFSFS